ncbi:hypothetical protein O1611_g218 [Lasiodiplodia mahajangana]|uniref:Uncharacterized protein n=1 Tax=Lasiodiplodia mahajangana TaxID=1108764 RepID=A0ACC2K1E2_9PEZI|nr:hypothetical protein O1611_g218 [Lasiodiplodia mahajangana]
MPPVHGRKTRWRPGTRRPRVSDLLIYRSLQYLGPNATYGDWGEFRVRWLASLFPHVPVNRDPGTNLRCDDLGPSEFRLLQWQLSLDALKGWILQFKSVRYNLLDCPPYTALSYTWQEDENQIYDFENGQLNRVIVDGRCLPIGSKLSWALKWLFKHGRTTIWIDALCINQDNPLERGHQVGLMRDIYTQANEVFIFLGNPSPAIARAFSFLGHLHPSDNMIPDGALPGLAELLQNPYWVRGWVIQEIANALELRIVCGEQFMPWEKFMELFQQPQFKAMMRHDRPTTPSPARHIQEINEFRTQGFSSPLIHVLQRTRNAKLSDPRDSVYAKLGLSVEAESLNFQPDYTVGLEEMLRRLAVVYTQRQRSLYFFCLAGETTLNLPSWVPDWSRDDGKRPILLDNLNYTAAQDNFFLEASVDMKTASVRGVVIDHIGDVTAESPRSSQSVRTNNDLKSEWELEAPKSPETMFPAICRTVVANQSTVADVADAAPDLADFTRIFAIQALMSEAALKQENSMRRDTRLWGESAAGSMSFDSWWRSSRDVMIGGRALYFWAMSYAQNWIFRNHAVKSGDRGLRNDFCTSLAVWMRGRRLVGSSKGFPVLAPQASKPGDLLCWLLGCPVPVVLRAFPDRTNSYRFIGEAYVDGMMEGTRNSSVESQQFNLI